MGIRFDKDTRRATSGPVIFFTAVRDETFIEEIRNAVISGISFYAYRFPGDSMLTYGASESIVEGLETPGFVIGRFSPELPFITIPYKNVKATMDRGHQYTMPEHSTTFCEYQAQFAEIKERLRAEKGRKVVAATVMVREKSLDIAEKFYDLCDRFPDSFVFSFSTPVTGCWIGASPELLMRGRERQLETMALAGTRKVGETGEWDEKNKEEQRIVTEYIEDGLKNNGLSGETGDTFTKKAGPIEHICTHISATLGGNFDIKKLEDLIRDLSPTPALCGSPKQFAMEVIKATEPFNRGCYGGFCGPYNGVKDFAFHVVLRCASVSDKRFCVYAGGGITLQSVLDTEWKEIESKVFGVFPEAR